MIVMDTNVVSELMRADPARVVSDWLRAHGDRELRMTSVTLAEIGYGLQRLPPGRRRDALTQAANDLFNRFDDQILPFDAAAAIQYGSIVASRDRAGRPIAGFDAQIASICQARGAQLATRNSRDFEGTGVTLLDPWMHV